MAVMGFVTCKDSAEAKQIAGVLLKSKLVACANIVPAIDSIYWWKGKLQQGSETLLLIKTRRGLTKRIAAKIKKLHSYELPVIEFIETELNKEAGEWIRKETRK